MSLLAIVIITAALVAAVVLFGLALCASAARHDAMLRRCPPARRKGRGE